MPTTTRKHRGDPATAPAEGWFRAVPLRAKPAPAEGVKRVDRDARRINGYAVATVGEALGHGLWLDADTLQQIAEQGNARENGLKGRYTHPGLSSDGMGKHLGRSKNFQIDGEICRADLELAKCASRSPDGDLAGYVMDLAEEDPESFGSSIVFERDREAELAFMLEHGATVDDDGWLDESEYKSPDPRNTSNYRHVRLRKLRACDVVDEPAANPGGMFGANTPGEHLASHAETLLPYLLGLSEEVPAESFGVHPERARAFVSGWLERHGLSVSTTPPTDPQPDREAPMTPDEFAKAHPEAVEKWKQEGADLSLARFCKLRAAIPGRPEFVAEQFAGGASVVDAKAALSDVLLGEAKAKDEELAEQRQRAAAALAAGRPDTGVSVPTAQFQEIEPIKPKAEAGRIPSFEEEAEATWNANTDLQAQFRGDFDDFLAFRRAEARDSVRISESAEA